MAPAPASPTRSPSSPSEFAPCRWGLDVLAPGRRRCDSPKVVVKGDRGVGAETCAKCFARDHEPAAAPAAPAPAPAPCRWEGRELTGPERVAAGKDHARPWRRCDHPKKPLGAVVCPCQGCNPTCRGYAVEAAESSAGGAVVIDHGAGGIGDGLLGLAAVARLSADHPETPVEYRVSAAARPFVALFDGYARLGTHAKPHSEAPVPGARQLNAGYKAENASRYPVPRWERYAQNIGAAGVLLPKLRDPETVKAAGADLAGCVALCPFSTDRAREWSVHHWLTLERQLRAAGYRTAVLHADAKPLAPFAGAKVAGAAAERVAGVLLNACCVVGTDSGLAHLAGILSAPTVVLGGSTPVERIFGAYPRVTCIQGGLDCSGCCGGTGVAVGGPFDERCKASCANLQSVTPERVLAAVDRLAFADLTAGRTLIGPDRLAVIRAEVRRTNGLPGELAECGVYRGGSAKLVARHAAGGTLHLFDALGIPADDADPRGHRAGEFAGDERDLRSFLAGENVAFHFGVFPDTAADLPPDARFRFVHLDMDTEASTRAGIAYFWPRLVPGGVLVMDDVDWKMCPGVRRAIEDLLPGIEVETPARYQGVIRKPA